MRSPHYDGAMSFSETIFLFVLALVVFGPKKLPEIARQAGKLLAELRRASNEFKSQIETEIAHLEVEKAQTTLPPSPPPQGAVPSLSLNPAADPVPQAEPATLAAAESPEAAMISPVPNTDDAPAVTPPVTTSPAVADGDLAAQDSHV